MRIVLCDDHKFIAEELGKLIAEFDRNITLVNGEMIPVSRRRWKAFQMAYMKFDTSDYRL